MSRHTLPLSILALAAAIAFHAVAPAHATDTAGMPPKCVFVKNPNIEALNTTFQSLYAEGAREFDFVVITTGIVCGWR